MHAAKGLEYDIVMIPMPVFSKRSKNGNDPALFHIEQDDGYISGLELGDNEHHRSLSASEEQQEDMRLLYVAMTRGQVSVLPWTTEAEFVCRVPPLDDCSALKHLKRTNHFCFAPVTF